MRFLKKSAIFFIRIHLILYSMNLSIKKIQSPIQGKCGLCEKDITTGSGYALFVPETENPVCQTCAIKNDPKLLVILQFITEQRRFNFLMNILSWYPHAVPVILLFINLQWKLYERYQPPHAIWVCYSFFHCDNADPIDYLIFAGLGAIVGGYRSRKFPGFQPKSNRKKLKQERELIYISLNSFL